MSEIDLSVVVPVRNRSGQRLDNCLGSLAGQALPEGTAAELVVSDFGSDPEHAASVAELCARHGAHVVRSDTRDLWNRSRALNIGIRAARGRFVLCTDADMILRPDFLATALETLRASPDDTLVLCRCRDLPESVPEQAWSPEDYAALETRATFRKEQGLGACQAAERAFFERVGGYDEQYVFWGFEDKDMVERAQRGGLRVEWIHERTSMLHQWHPSVMNARRWLKWKNKVRFYLTKSVVTKNRRGWGER